MAVAFVLNHTHGEISSSGTNNVSATLAGNVAAGNLIVIAMAFDNLSATTPTITSITVPAGETATWSRVAFCDASSATAAGAVRGECWVIVTTQQWNTGQTITPTLSGAVTAKDVVCSEFSGCTATPRGTQGTTNSASANTAGALAVTTTGTAPVAGDLCLGGGAVESSTNLTDDTTNTTGGAWSASNKDATAIGGGTSNAGVILQYKIPTVSGHQTYTPGTSAGDAGSYVIALVPSGGTGPETHTGTAALAGAGALAVTGVPAFPSRPVPLAATGALVVAGVPRPAGAPALTGAGSLAPAGVPALTGAPGLAGAGSLAVAGNPAVADLVDDFQSENDATWFYATGAAVVSGRLALTVDATYPGIYSNAVFSLINSSVFIQAVQAPNVGNATTEAFLKLVAGGNSLELGFSGGTLMAIERLSGVVDAVTASWDAAAMQWWRIRHDGVNAIWQYSADAVSWTTLRTKAPSFAVDAVHVNVVAGFYGTEPSPGTALFDNLNVAPAVGFTGAATLTGTGSLTSAAAVAVSGAPALSASGALQAPAVPAFPSRPVPFAATGALVVAGVPRPIGAPALTATGALAVPAVPAFPSQPAALTGIGTLAVTATAPVSTLTDDFTAQDTTKWGGWVPGQVDLVSGRVQVTTTSSYYSLNTNSVGQMYALAGSSMMVELVQAPNVGNGTTSASMWFSLDLGTNDVSFQVEGGNLVCRINLAGVLNNTVPAAYDPTAHRWLRMSESGGTLTWATSPDAVTWTTQRTASTPMSLARGYVMLMSGFYGTETTPGVALFDNFNNVPASVISGPVPLAGTGTLTTAVTVTAAGTGTLTATGSLAVAGAATAARAVALSGGGSLAPAGVPRPTGVAAFSATGSLAPAAAPAVTGAVALSGGGGLTGAAASAGVVTLAAAGSLAPAVSPAPTAAPTLTGVGDLTLAVSTGISYIGAGAVASAAATSITPGLPAGIAANDVLLAVLHSNDNVAVTPPTGWATAGAVNAGTGSRTTVLWKRAAGGDVAQAFTKTGTVAFIGRIIAFRGVTLTGNPYAVTPTTTAKTTASTAFSLTGLTPTTANNVVVACVGALVDANSTTVFSGWTSSGTGAMTEAVDNATNTLNGGAVGAAYALRSAAAATGNITGTMTSAVNGGVVVALVPAPPPVAPSTVTATATGTTTVQVAWSGGTTTGVTWTVQYAPAAAGPWSTAAAGLTASPYTHTGLSPGTTYWYRVAAVNPSSGSSASAATSATTVALPKVSTLTDDFATADAAKWTGYGPNVAINAGRLEITTTASYFAVTSVNRYDLRDSIATVEVLQVPNLGNGSTGCNMLLQIDGNNRVEILWEGGQINAKYVVNGVTNNVATTYNAVAHKIWRLRESGGTLYWEASSSGAAWVNLRTPVPMPIDPSSLQVAMTSGFYGTETAPGSALFDNLNATYADPPAAPRTIYVDPAGNDANDGLSTSTPWATVAKVTNTLLYPGDQVLFLRGQQWTGNLVITGSGTAAAPIFIGAYGTPTADIPTITGGGSSGTVGTLKPLEIYGSYVTVDSVELNGSIDRDIYVNGSDCLIQGCAIRWGAVGIEQTTQAARLKIQYNSFIDVNVGIIQPGTNDDYGANCIILDGDAAEVAHNTASGAWYVSPDYGMDGSFCDIYGATNAVIHHNYASETVAFGEIGNPSSDNNTFHNNVFVSTLSLATGFVVHGALYQDASVDPFGPVTNTKIHHNTVVLPGGGAGAAGVWLSPNGEIDLQNNIFVVTAAATMAAIYDSNRIITEAGNVFYANGGVNITLPAGGLDPSSIIADPLFVSPTDLRLQPGSPALDRGIDLGYTTDYAGNPRVSGTAPDSGAYEGATTAAVAGVVTLAGTGSLAAAGVPAVAAPRGLTAGGALVVVGAPTPTVAPGLAGTGSLAVAGIPRPVAAPVLAAVGSLVVTAAPAPVAAPALSGTGSLAATAAVSAVTAPGLAGTGSLVVTATPRPVAGVTLAAAGTLAVPAVVPALVTAPALAGVGTLVVTATGAVTGTATLAGTGSLTVPTRVPTIAPTITLGGVGALNVAPVVSTVGAATLAGAGSLAVIGSGGAGAVTLLGTGSLVVAVPGLAVAGTVTLAGAGALTSAALVGTPGTANLATAGTLGIVTVPAPVAGVPLTGIGALGVGAAPGLVGTAGLAGAGALVTAVAVAVAVAVPFAGVGVLTLTTAGSGGGVVTLTGGGALGTAGIPTPTPAVALAGTGALSTVSTVGAVGTVTMSGIGALSAIRAVPVPLNGGGSLTVSIVPVLTATPGLSAAGVLVVVFTPRPTGAVTLTGAGSLAAAVSVAVVGIAAMLSAVGALAALAGFVAAGGVAALTVDGQLVVVGHVIAPITHPRDTGRTTSARGGVTPRPRIPGY